MRYPHVDGMCNFHALQCSYTGLQYHALMALGTWIVTVSGGLKILARYPSGAKGTQLKSCGTSKMWYAESWGWVRDVRSIFNVSCACLINLHQSTDGIFHHMC